MASPLQNRIVGTVILVALAVIVLPDLLDGQKTPRDDEFESIPLRPVVEFERVEAQFPDDFDEKLEQAPEPELNESDDVFVPVQEPVEATTEPQLSGYVIRLGAFRNRDNVERLVSQLRAEGFNAYMREMRGSQGVLHVLLVGPELNEATLREQIPALQELTGLEGIVERYRPAEDS